MKSDIAFLTGSLFLGMALPSHTDDGRHHGKATIQPVRFVHMPFVKSLHPPNDYARGNPVNEQLLRTWCLKIQQDRRRIYYLNDRSYRMNMQLRGIYTGEGMMFFRLFIRNHSHVDFETDSIRCVIRDAYSPWYKPDRGTQVLPLYIFGNSTLIRGKAREEPIIVLPKLTLPAHKRLVIELLEKNGARHMSVHADNFALVRSRLI